MTFFYHPKNTLFNIVIVNLFQKSNTPILESLPVPPFESESKKAQIKAAPKLSNVPTVEGTSVMPRQRPKGTSAAPLNLGNIPLTISPSPTSTKRSQSPIAQYPLQQNIAGNTPQTSFPNNDANILKYTSINEYQPTPILFPNPEVHQPQLDSLFQSSIYPDPFRDEILAHSPTTKVDLTTEYRVDSYVNQAMPPMPLNLSPVSPDNPLFDGDNVNQKRTQVKSGLTESNYIVGTNTPPCSPTLSVPKGHRRNMSDTTAFSK